MKCGALPAGKGYKSGKDATASCGGKCEYVLRAAQVRLGGNSGWRKLANGKSVSTPCGTLFARLLRAPTQVRFGADPGGQEVRAGSRQRHSAAVSAKTRASWTSSAVQAAETGVRDGQGRTTPCGGVSTPW